MTLAPARVPRLIVVEEAGSANGLDSPRVPVQTWRDSDGTDLAHCHRDGDLHRVDVSGLASFSFNLGGEVVRATISRAASRDTVRLTYERMVAPLVLQALGTEVLHASAIHGPRGVVAFCGDSGAGKSTIAFGLGRRDYPMRADDAVAVEVSDALVSALALPFAIRLRPASARYFGCEPRPARTRVMRDGDRPTSGGRAPLAALCLLEQAVDVGGVAIARLPPSSAFRRLLTHAYCFSLQDRARKRRMIERYLDLSARVPVFEVRFDTGLDRLVKILDALEGIVNDEPVPAR